MSAVQPVRTHGRSPVEPIGLLAAITCGLTAATYSSFLLAPLARSTLPTARSYVSELEAAGQPYRDLFRLTDVVSGGGLILIAILCAVFRPRNTMALLSTVLLAVTGIASLLDAANPMTCAPSIDRVCRAHQDTAAGLVAQVIQPHTMSSLVGFLASAACMLLAGRALLADVPSFGRSSIACAVATAVLGLADIPLLLTDGAIGISERVRILIFSGWLLALGVVILRRGRDAAESTPVTVRNCCAGLAAGPSPR